MLNLQCSARELSVEAVRSPAPACAARRGAGGLESAHCAQVPAAPRQVGGFLQALGSTSV